MGVNHIIIGTKKENVQFCLDAIKESVESSGFIGECSLETTIDYHREFIKVHFTIEMGVDLKTITKD